MQLVSIVEDGEDCHVGRGALWAVQVRTHKKGDKAAHCLPNEFDWQDLAEKCCVIERILDN